VVESRYSQLKLELYGVLRAFKAERHCLYNIHIKLQVNAISLIQMTNSPDLPNAAMTRWITYILMFSFNGEIDIEGVKLLKALDMPYSEEFREISLVEFLEQEFDIDEDLRVKDTHLDHRIGECMVFEVSWLEPERLMRAK
jgi:hypothetical protein